MELSDFKFSLYSFKTSFSNLLNKIFPPKSMVRAFVMCSTNHRNLLSLRFMYSLIFYFVNILSSDFTCNLTVG